jgi:hypothetical protein
MALLGGRNEVPNLLEAFLSGDWESLVLFACIFLGGVLVMASFLILVLVWLR